MTQFDRVRTFAEEQRIFTSRDIADELGLSMRDASTYCRELGEMGLAVKDGKVKTPGVGRNLTVWRWR